MPSSQISEAQFLLNVATWVNATHPKVAEIDRRLTKTKKTTRTLSLLRHGALVCSPRVVQDRPGDSHLQLTFWRYSAQERHGLRQESLRNDLSNAKRRFTLLKRRTKTITVVCHRPLMLPPQVEANIRARGDDPDAFKAAMLDAFRRRAVQRLSSLKLGRHPGSHYWHRVFDLPPLATVEEAAVAVGLPLVQEGIIEDAAVKYLLVTHLGVPGAVVKTVWKHLKLHYSDPQHPGSLRAYLKRVVNNLCPPKGGRTFRDESGAEYWTVARAAQELRVQVQQEREQWAGRPKPRALKTNKTTLYRWINACALPVREFSYQTRSGIWKTDQMVARVDIECIRDTHFFDEGVIILLCKAHHITRSSAERQYRRICQRLDVRASAPIKSDEQKKAILAVLEVDPKVVRYRKQKRPLVARKEEPEVAEGGMEEIAWAAIRAGHLHLSKAP